jgi:hypothetical protein
VLQLLSGRWNCSQQGHTNRRAFQRAKGASQAAAAAAAAATSPFTQVARAANTACNILLGAASWLELHHSLWQVPAGLPPPLPRLCKMLHLIPAAYSALLIYSVGAVWLQRVV